MDLSKMNREQLEQLIEELFEANAHLSKILKLAFDVENGKINRLPN
ncbi:hypothetical protein [Lactococcus lactis]|nr:hypothetical protein [Lactococcus lactis]